MYTCIYLLGVPGDLGINSIVQAEYDAREIGGRSRSHSPHSICNSPRLVSIFPVRRITSTTFTLFSQSRKRSRRSRTDHQTSRPCRCGADSRSSAHHSQAPSLNSTLLHDLAYRAFTPALSHSNEIWPLLVLNPEVSASPSPLSRGTLCL